MNNDELTNYIDEVIAEVFAKHGLLIDGEYQDEQSHTLFLAVCEAVYEAFKDEEEEAENYDRMCKAEGEGFFMSRTRERK